MSSTFSALLSQLPQLLIALGVGACAIDVVSLGLIIAAIFVRRPTQAPFPY